MRRSARLCARLTAASAAAAAVLVGRGPDVAAEGISGFDLDPFWLWHDVAAGDLDDDGFDDLCAVEARIDRSPPHRARVVRFRQDPSRPGRFRRLAAVDVGDDSWRVRVADLDGDGRLDAVTGAPNGVTIVRFPAEDEPQVQRLHTSGGVDGVAIGDADGDGLPDVVAATWRGTVVLRQDAAAPGTFLAAERVAFASMDAVVGEFSGGPAPDLAAAAWEHRFLAATDLTAGEPASKRLLPARRGWQALALADLDGDGREELVHAGGGRTGARRVEAWLDPPDAGGAAVVSRAGTPVMWIAAADFDRDGRPDLAVGNHTRVTWLRQSPDEPGRFERAASRSIGRFRQFGTVGDFDADGLPDIAFVGGGVRVVLQDRERPGRLLAPRRVPRAE